MNLTPEELNWKLLDIATHEMRNPLATILGFCDLLSLEDDQEKRKQYLGYVQEKALRMNGLILQLLDISRHHLGKAMPTQQRPHEISQFVTQHKKSWEDLGQIIFTVDVEEANLMIDKDRFQVLFDELCTNALKFGRRIPRITLQGRRSTDWYELMIQDNGPGILEAHRAQALELFWSSPAPNGKTPGMGLGLASVKAIMKAHEGTILLDDAPEGGLKILLRFPLKT